MAQISLLGLSQFIDIPTVESRRVTCGSPKQPWRLTTSVSEESCDDDDDPRHADGRGATQETTFEDHSQPRVVDLYVSYVQYSDITGSSEGEGWGVGICQGG